MGFDAKFQALPSDWEMLRRARVDIEYAECLEFFNLYVTDRNATRLKRADTSPLDLEFYRAAKALVAERPGLLERYLYSASRSHDSIIYLLSPGRCVGEYKNDPSLVRKAFYGFERLHPTATAGQGIPIGFVSVRDVRQVADFFKSVSREQLHEHYNPAIMVENYVYKMRETDNEQSFDYIWDDFSAIRDLYRGAADHDEIVITVID